MSNDSIMVRLRRANPVPETPAGDDSDLTLAAMGNLAEALRGLGDLARAHEIQQNVLDARRRLHGDEHPATLTATGAPTKFCVLLVSRLALR